MLRHAQADCALTVQSSSHPSSYLLLGHAGNKGFVSETLLFARNLCRKMGVSECNVGKWTIRRKLQQSKASSVAIITLKEPWKLWQSKLLAKLQCFGEARRNNPGNSSIFRRARHKILETTLFHFFCTKIPQISAFVVAPGIKILENTAFLGALWRKNKKFQHF